MSTESTLIAATHDYRPDQLERLERLRQLTGVPKSLQMRRALDAYLEREERKVAQMEAEPLADAA